MCHGPLAGKPERKEEITTALDAIYHMQDMGSSTEVFLLWESLINYLSPCVGCKLGACSAAWQGDTQGGEDGMTSCPTLAHTLAGMMLCALSGEEGRLLEGGPQAFYHQTEDCRLCSLGHQPQRCKLHSPPSAVVKVACYVSIKILM